MTDNTRATENRAADLQGLKLYTLTDLEEIIGVSHMTLLRHVKAGKLPARKIAGKWRVTEADLREYLQGEQ